MVSPSSRLNFHVPLSSSLHQCAVGPQYSTRQCLTSVPLHILWWFQHQKARFEVSIPLAIKIQIWNGVQSHLHHWRTPHFHFWEQIWLARIFWSVDTFCCAMRCWISNPNRCRRTGGTYCPWYGWTCCSLSTTSNRFFSRARSSCYGSIWSPRSSPTFLWSWTRKLCIPSHLSPDKYDKSFALIQNNKCYSESHPFAFAVKSAISMDFSPEHDTMTLSEALKQPDCHEFIKTMEKELRDHIDQKYWKVVPLKSIPVGKHTIPIVWSMKRKRNPLEDIVKWKARLCAGGHRSIKSIDYFATYSLVVSWSTVRLMIVFAILKNWHMESINFVLVFPQAPIKTDIYIRPPKIPSGFSILDLSAFSDRFLSV